MTNIAERVSESTLVWMLGIYAEDARNGVLSRYLKCEAWSRIGRVTEKVGRVACALDRIAYDRWVWTGREWEGQLDRVYGRDVGARFFTRPDDFPRLSTETQKEERV